jgi:hypothetical protein
MRRENGQCGRSQATESSFHDSRCLRRLSLPPAGRLSRNIGLADNRIMGSGRPLSPRGSIAVGILVAAVGVAIITASALAPAQQVHAPRWVVACAGGSFVFFGGWTAAIYALGFDPKNPQETLPSARVQLAVFIPGMLCLAAPFHWVAFGPGPRQFSGSFSIPFLTIRHGSGEWSGRAMFGLGSLMMDAILIASVVTILKRSNRRD